MQARGSVEFQVDVQDTSLTAFEAMPAPAFGDRYGKLDKVEGLACLGRTRNQHLMSFPEDSLYQLRSKLREVIPFGDQFLKIGEVVVDSFRPFLPLVPRLAADICIDNELPFLSSLASGKA